MHYTVTPQSGYSHTHLWDIADARQYDGGFLLKNVPSSLNTVPAGTLVKVDTTARTAEIVKSAKLAAAIATADTTVKVAKGSTLAKGDVIGIGGKSVTLGAITTSNAAYDTFTITAGALGAVDAGEALVTYANGAAAKVDGLVTADVDVDDNPTCSVTFAAYGIKEAELPFGAGSDVKAQLTHCQFI